MTAGNGGTIRRMLFIKSADGSVTVELTERNLAALLAKLDDPLSSRILADGSGSVLVRSVEDGKARSAVAAERVIELTRSQLSDLLDEPGSTVTVDDITVVSVADSAHYSERPPGRVYMPSSGESW